MNTDTNIRASLAGDIPDIEKLLRDAFPDEDLLPLVRDLLRAQPSVVSLVALRDADLCGHIVFSRCAIAGRTEQTALLGPLAVAPALQGRGIGRSLVNHGLEQLQAEGIIQVQVLGDPAYYGRFGFQTDTELNPPYPLPDEWRPAWQTVCLQEGVPTLKGRLVVPPPWRQPALWAP